VKLDAIQEQAVEMASRELVSIITGGPGTGKSTICKAVLAAWDAAGVSPVALCAPTGKAARRLSEQTQREASTIHRLLGYNPILGGFCHGKEERLEHQAIIVDEASMVDVELAAALLEAVADGARVVFVGDVDQLPSVGPGAVLADLIGSGRVPTVRLETIYRQREASFISVNARRIREGMLPELEGCDDFFWHEVRAAEDVARLVVKLAVEEASAGREVQVLCPQHTTAVGVQALNGALQAALNPRGLDGPSWRVASGAIHPRDRVMQVKNNYALQVMNGEIGVVLGMGGDPPELAVDFGDRVVRFERKDAFDLTLAYATTIHKAQGSEYPVVLVPVHSANTFMLSRALLYTAVTRGKDRVVLVGDRKGLKRAVANGRAVERYTGLRERVELALNEAGDR
jgi:exodeoxyribonuclease V alpha subunit